MKIAVLGGGYAGLSVAIRLVEKGYETHLYQLKEEFASKISTGFLHPYVGKFPRRPKLADLFLKKTEELLVKAESASSQPIRKKQGLFRPALFPAQEKYFQKLSKKDSKVVFWTKEEVREKIVHTDKEGIFIEEGQKVFNKPYLKALFSYGESLGLKRFFKPFEEKNYQAVVEAKGPNTSEKAVYFIKGQKLKIAMQENWIPFPVVGNPHISETEVPGEYEVGSTYEKNYLDLLPDEKAEELLEKLGSYLNMPKEVKILEKSSAIRVYAKEEAKPIIKKVSEKKWIFTGLASKGLLWHGYYSELLVDELISFLEKTP